MFSMIQTLIASLHTGRREEGQAMVEYVLVLVLVAVAAAAAFTGIATQLGVSIGDITGALAGA